MAVAQLQQAMESLKVDGFTYEFVDSALIPTRAARVIGDTQEIVDDRYRQQQIVKRPSSKVEDMKKGAKTITVSANYYRLKFRESIHVYQYNVELTIGRARGGGRGGDGRGGSRPAKREEAKEMFWQFVQTFPTVFFAPTPDAMPLVHKFVFNDVNVLWTTEKLRSHHANNRDGVSIGFQYEPPMEPGRSQPAQCRITPANEMTLRPSDQGDRFELQPLFDNVMTMRLRCLLRPESHYFYSRGRSLFYTPPPESNDHDRFNNGMRFKIPLGGGLEARTGLFGANKLDCEGGFFYNVDIGTERCSNSTLARRCHRCHLHVFVTLTLDT